MHPAHGLRMPTLATSPADRAYIRATYTTLAALAGERAMPVDPLVGWAGVVLPAASYWIDDEGWFARDWWRLYDDAGGADGIAGLFARRYRAAVAALGHRDDLATEWPAYLEGVYGVCLRDVTPENIVAKDRLVARIDHALAAPRPDAAVWCATLRADVEALDGLSRAFADCDHARFGRPTSRARCIEGARTAYPAAFG